MRFLIDMPLSPRLVVWLTEQGDDAVHALDVGRVAFRMWSLCRILIRQYAVETDIHPFVRGANFDLVWRNRVRARFGKTSSISSQ